MPDNSGLVAEIYARFADKVACYVARRVARYHDREELVSSVFLKIQENISSYDESRGSLSSWVFAITHNTVCNYYRKASRERAAVAELAATYVGAADTGPSVESDASDALADALEKLDERERAVTVLYYYHGRPLKEVAALMEISYANAKFLRHRAAAKLRKILESDDRIKET